MPFISQPLPAASAPTQPRGPGRENGFTGCPESPAGAGRGRQGHRAAEKQLCQSPRPLRRLCSPGFGFFYGGWNREHSLGAAPGRRLLMLTSSRRFFPLQTIKKKTQHHSNPSAGRTRARRGVSVSFHRTQLLQSGPLHVPEVAKGWRPPNGARLGCHHPSLLSSRPVAACHCCPSCL